jgi:hypothetical protein
MSSTFKMATTVLASPDNSSAADGFDVAVKKLLRAMQEVNDATSSPMNFARSEPYWVICLGKFHAAYLKANNPDGFKPMFRKFYETQRENFKEYIIEEGNVYDEWLKVKDTLPGPGKSKSSNRRSSKSNRARKSNDDDCSWTPSATCKGHVVYFNTDNEKLRAVSIPLSEAYLHACKHYSDLSKEKGVCSPLPATILHSLYTAISYVRDPEDQDIFDENIANLRDIVESLTPEDSGTEGSTLDPLKGMMKALAKNSGFSSVNGADESQINNVLGTLFNSETSNKITNVVKTVTEQISTTNSNNVSDVIGQIGSLLQNPTLSDMVKDTVESAQRLEGTIPTAETVSQQAPPPTSVTTVIDAAEQE